MPYYAGDFYTGRTGYYRGDPGFLGSFGSFVSKVYHGVKDVAIPIAATAIAGPAAGIAAKAVIAARQAGGAAARVAVQHPVLTAAGAAGTIGAITGISAARRGHPSFPGRMGAAGAVPGMRRRRRMRVTNPKALRRAIRRAHGFEKLARKVIGFSSPRKPKGHMYFKRKRSRK